MATSNILAAMKVLLPSKKGNEKGVAQTGTFDASNAQVVLTTPTYRDHLTDIYSTRTSEDSRALIKQLMQLDPDMSAAMNAFLTVADTWPIIVARTLDGEIDRAGQKVLMQIITALTTRSDYSQGFKIAHTMNSITEAMRYMILMRGGCAAELVLNKAVLPAELRHVDLASVEWFEKNPGQYTPSQKTKAGTSISLDVPTFFASWFRKDPTEIYSKSYFVSAINTIAARQQVINDLYRIMQLTGYPRMSIKVLQEVLLKGARPDEIDTTPKKTAYVNQKLNEISVMVQNIRPDQAFVHTDSMETGMLNEKAPGMSLDISSVIETLNAQNQAGLKTMATILGRGTSGVNTASVEARIFALNAQSLNEPIADIMSQILTLALRLTGSESYVDFTFTEVEMKSKMELQTQEVVKATRLRTDLSSGLITDDEYHLWMYGRLAPDSAPLLSGTNFETASANVDATNITPNADPLGRSVSAEGGNKGARNNRAK